MELNSLFKAISKRFNIEFDELAAEHEHNLTAGEAREFALIELLRTYLPTRVGVDRGFIIDALGGTSKQIDVVIYDKTVGTVFKINDVNYFPCETVVAVGEVKSDIGSTDKLVDSLEKIASVKELDRSNKNTNKIITGPGISLGGIHFEPDKNHRDQILGFVFTKTTMQQKTIINALQHQNDNWDRKLWSNVFCAYGDFLISYETENGLSPSAMDATYMYCTKESEIPDLLLQFYSILATFVSIAHVARPNYFSYGSVTKANATYYALTP